MGRAEKKKKNKSNDSSVTQDLSQALDNIGTLCSTVRTLRSSSPKKDMKNSALAKDCHLYGSPHCKSADEIAFVCSNLIAEHLGYDIDLTARLKGHVEKYFKLVGVV